MDLKQTIMSLSNTYGVSGDEDKACEKALEMLKEFTSDCYVKNNSVFGNFGKREEGKPHILLDAHIDMIGFVVTFITDEGFVKIANCGGIDRRILAAEQVVILGKEQVKGVICTMPPHLSKGDGKVPEWQDISIDVGMTKEQAEKVISLGDKVVFMQHSRELAGDRITGAALDDRCGVACLLRTAELLKDAKLNCSYTIMFSSQEEVGERGAKVGVYDVDPDIAIAVDVSFALTSDDSELKCGKMGKGCMIGFSPVLDRELSLAFVSAAEKNDLPYQREIMHGETGTNADRFSVNCGGVKAVTLSIPLKYMHTPVEVISVSDVENTAQLIAAYMKEVR
jgi:endoglucanase